VSSIEINIVADILCRYLYASADATPANLENRVRFEEMDDAELVLEANKGARRALELLYLRHREWVVQVARGYVGGAEDVLDVMQEVFLSFFKAFPGFRLTSTLRAYLYPVVRNCAISLLRKRKKVIPLSREALEGIATVQPSLPAEFAETIQRLSPPLREVVYLRFALDFRLEEMAEALGLPVGTVKSRLHNALKLLREDADLKKK
jgi:RNA polymerase sigma-70 factor (ECF subfamily)